MFGFKSNVDADAQAVIEEACCIVDDAVSEVAEECCVSIEKDSQRVADEKLLSGGHPSLHARWPGEIRWYAMTEGEKDAFYDEYDRDLKAYHAAYLRVHGVECRDCTC